jgi:hypothetical protein
MEVSSMNGMTDAESGTHSKDVPSNTAKTSDFTILQNSAIVVRELSRALQRGACGF